VRLPEIWDNWVTYDDNGISGIRDDAPDNVKQEFEKYLNQQKDLETAHTKI
jgi:hypothetical protein